MNLICQECGSIGKRLRKSKKFKINICDNCYRTLKHHPVLYMPPKGELHYDKEGKVICHECGRSFHKLSTHIKTKHKMDIKKYKEKHGLNNNTKLTSKELQLKFKNNPSVNILEVRKSFKKVNYCIKNTIGTIVVGYNIDFKRKINIGRKNNQNFTQIPIGKLREKLQSLCERYNINYIEQEESYTSKSDFLGNDILPIYNADSPKKYSFKGKRISRGQYKSSTGVILNADINGALNILNKANIVDTTPLLTKKIKQPLRIRIE